MKRRTLLAGLGSLTAGNALVVGSGAFNSVSADRSVSVETAADFDALLTLTQRGAGERSEFDGSPSELEFSLPGDDEDEYPTGNPTDPDGLGVDSVYRFSRDAAAGTPGLFSVENNGTQPVSVYSTQSESSDVPEVTMYDVNTGKLLTKDDPSAPLPAGESLNCGLEVDTHDVPIRSVEYDVTLTISAIMAND